MKIKKKNYHVLNHSNVTQNYHVACVCFSKTSYGFRGKTKKMCNKHNYEGFNVKKMLYLQMCRFRLGLVNNETVIVLVSSSQGSTLSTGLSRRWVCWQRTFQNNIKALSRWRMSISGQKVWGDLLRMEDS